MRIDDGVGVAGQGAEGGGRGRASAAGFVAALPLRRTHRRRIADVISRDGSAPLRRREEEQEEQQDQEEEEEEEEGC